MKRQHVPEFRQHVTLAWVKKRCTDDGGCWRWNLSCSAAGLPTYSFRRQDDGRPTMQMRRVAWEVAHGAIPGGMRVIVTCDCKTCLNPAHLALRTHSDVVRAAWTQAGTRARKVLALTEIGRRTAKLDMDKARYIRTSDKTIAALAQEFEVSAGLVWRVRHGLAWRDHSNPFAALVPANDSQRRAA